MGGRMCVHVVTFSYDYVGALEQNETVLIA